MSSKLLGRFPYGKRLIEIHKIHDSNFEVRIISFRKKEKIRILPTGEKLVYPAHGRIEPTSNKWGSLGYTYQNLERSVAKASALMANLSVKQ